MNPALRAFLAIILLWASGYFTFAFFNANPVQGKLRYIFALMAGVTGFTGLVLLLEAMGF